jgi:hypothetical protein
MIIPLDCGTSASPWYFGQVTRIALPTSRMVFPVVVIIAMFTCLVQAATTITTVCAHPAVLIWVDASRFRTSFINSDGFFTFSLTTIVARVAEDSFDFEAPNPGRLNFTISVSAQDFPSPEFVISNDAVTLLGYGDVSEIEISGNFVLGMSRIWRFDLYVFDDSDPNGRYAVRARNSTLVSIEGGIGETAVFTVLNDAEYWHNRVQSQTPGNATTYGFPSNDNWGNCSCAFRDSVLADVPADNLTVLYEPSAGSARGTTQNMRMPDGGFNPPTPKEVSVVFQVQMRLFYLHSDGTKHPLRYVIAVLDDDLLGGFQLEIGETGMSSGTWRASHLKSQRLPDTFEPRSRFIFDAYARHGFRIVTAAKPEDEKVEHWVAASNAKCSTVTKQCLLDFTLSFSQLDGVGTLWHHLSNLYESATAIVGTDDLPPVAVWYPNGQPSQQGYFSSSSNPVFIALDTSVRDEVDVIAHEYGHYFHWFTMGSWFPEIQGGAHSFCQPAAQSSGDAWVEGYATAFGLRIQEKVNIWSWGVSPEVTMRGTNIEHFKCASQKDMSVSEGRVAAGLWDVMDFAAGQNDSAGGAECNGGDTSLGADGHCDKTGFGIASWVLRDFLKGRHAAKVDDWVTYAVPLYGDTGLGWLESMRYNYYLGSSGIAGEHLIVQEL